MHIVNAVTQIKTARASFTSLGCHRNATAEGRSAPGCSPFLLEVILGKHQQVTALRCVAPGEEQEPHGLGHRLCGGPVRCRLYWLAAMLPQRRIRPKLSHEKQPWINKPNRKLYQSEGRLRPGVLDLRRSAPGSGQMHSRPSSQSAAPLVQPC